MLFSVGGVMSAMLMPVLALLFGIAFPLGWLTPPSYEHLLLVLGHPVTRIVLFGLCALSLFHWAHRFRHTLYDGLQIKHLNEMIAVICYGGAIAGTASRRICCGKSLDSSGSGIGIRDPRILGCRAIARTPGSPIPDPRSRIQERSPSPPSV